MTGGLIMKQSLKKSKILIFVFLFTLLFSVSALAVGNYKSIAYAFGWETSDSSQTGSGSDDTSSHTGQINAITSTSSSPDASDSQASSTNPEQVQENSSVDPAPISEQLSVKSSGSTGSQNTSSVDPNNESSMPTKPSGGKSSPTPAAPTSSGSSSSSSNPVSSASSDPISSIPPSGSSSGSTGHSGGSSSVHSVPIEVITLNQSDITIKKADTYALSAAVSPTNTTESKTVAWSSSDSSVVTVDSAGKVTALAAGSATITAQASGKTATCHVTVVVPATKITLNMTDLSLEKGESRTLSATVEPTDSTDKVAWATSNNNIVEVDSAGKITATGAGTATITASAEDGTIKASCTVTVGVSISRLQISDTALSLIKGDSHALTATIIPPDATEDKTITWSSSENTVAAVDSSGNVTAVEGGTAIITALDGTHSAQCTVTVTVPATGLTLSQSTASLPKGSEITLSAEITPADATDKNVNWSSSDSSIASVDSSGKVTANNVGTVIITATTTEGLTASCQVTVTIPVSGLTLDKIVLNLVKGNSDVLTPVITPPDATDKAIVWSSSNTNVATVDSSGKVTAVEGGTTTITATTHDGGFSASCTVTVTPKYYTVTATAVNGNITGTGSYPENSSITLTATANVGYHFVDWSDPSGNVVSSSATYAIAALSSDVKLTANFAPNSYTVTVTAGTGGTVSGGGIYTYGTSVTITATPDVNYHFAQWNDGNTSATRSFIITSDVTFIASFNPYYGDFTYVDNGDNTITIVSYSDNGPKEAVIPSSINGKTVTEIGLDAFKNKGLISITIADTVRAIDEEAFSGNDITSINIPTSVKVIGKEAFFNNQITSLTIPPSVTSIGGAAFSRNSLPDSEAFIYARNSDGSEDRSKLMSYGGISSDVVIPNTVRYIDFAFPYCRLTSVVIPSSVVEISASSFNGNLLPDAQAIIYARNSDGADDKSAIVSYGGCNKNLIIPDTVKNIADYAFENCGLTSIFIPSSVTHIGSGAFTENDLPDSQAFIYERNPDGTENTSSLNSYGGNNKNVVIPSTVVSIDHAAFTNCKIATVLIPDGVTALADDAFYFASVTRITIPASVTSIGTDAFARCFDLESITFKGKTNTDGITLGSDWNGPCVTILYES